ncbi:uncharacterized protein LOC116307161 [Actinia tenebrosa]|uniref:Uncharacterized protein LOC116307161 n=1 Tax=Actinia tenebrosa TaxID=6105 RepID=A0A6P8J0Y2_ACTTE|nr:uncharacterized protein LOC116307161 [Actinia tenebrosa]
MSLPAIVPASEEQLDQLNVKKPVKSHHGSANHSMYSKKTATKANRATKKKSEAEAKAAKEREERLVKLYDLWLQVKQDEREEKNQYFKERLNIQHELIQRQDLLSKKRQSKLNAKLHKLFFVRNKSGGIGAHQLWSILRGKSRKKLEKEDGKIPQSIKNAYRSFLRECLHADVPVVERSFCKNGDQIPESKISESHLIKDINFSRHRLDLMFRVAHMNKDKTRLLFNHMESADPKEGSVRPPRYNPDQIKEPKVELLPLSSGRTKSLVAEANDKGEVTTREESKDQPLLLGLDKISFLTEKMAECKGEFSKRHKVAGFANDSTTENGKDSKKQYSLRGTLSAPISSQGQRKIDIVKSWQPLSVDALLEYKTRVDLVGTEDFMQGQPRTWKLKEAIVQETG